MIHKHVYKHDVSRTHKRKGFVFVVCECGQRGQVSTLVNGKWRQEDVFTTNRYRGGSRVISFRVNDVRYEKWKKHRRELVEDFNKSIDKI